jgi:maltooligosyltrehalose trehalohydrolase
MCLLRLPYQLAAFGGWISLLQRSHDINFGTTITEGGIRFRLWAPKCSRIDVSIDGEKNVMHASKDGWHEFISVQARAGSLYQYILPDGLKVPDPASRFQPRDVHGPSEVIDPSAYTWGDEHWRGRPWEECVLYEIHVGTFTLEGTFLAAISHLDALVDLGVTAIELMPIADFPGQRNWGYDGVLLFAPDSSYGRPNELKALIDAAHAKGLMVFLDVVYNHFGPDGNYLPAYAPIFKDQHTPWGAAINYDADDSNIVREFIVANAAYWIEEYHFDGLRLDAIHAIVDKSHKHLLELIAQTVRKTAAGRHIHLIIENEDNQASWLKPEADGRALLYTAQWNDDIHHVLHTAATGETSGYYVEYADDTKKLGRALAEGFAFQGELMAYRGTTRGEPSTHLPPTAFVAFIQNHDQIGNRAFGERLTTIAPCEAIRAIAAIYLLSPQIPMIFMGEEWAAPQPFPFFCDFTGALSDAVREGRRAEFAKFPEFQDPAQRERIPDPTSDDTFLSAKLKWQDMDKGIHAEWRAFYKSLLRVRQAEIIPRLIGSKSICFEVLGDEAVLVAWMLSDGATLTLCANLKDRPLPNFEIPIGRRIWNEGATAKALGPWSVIWLVRAEDETNASA